MHVNRSIVFSITLFFTFAAKSAFAFSTPEVGELCAPGSSFDGANCNFGSPPQGTNAFVYENKFYATPSSPAHCNSPLTFDGANCFLRKIPSNYNPFIFQNRWYTQQNQHLKLMICPPGFSPQGTKCFGGAPPLGAGRNAIIRDLIFGFNKISADGNLSCGQIMQGAVGDPSDLNFCKFAPVPKGFTGFIANNAWYTNPAPNGGSWFSKPDISPDDKDHRLVCLKNERTPPKAKTLVWSDEFNEMPEGTPCYSSATERPFCVIRTNWGFEYCPDSPVGWSQQQRQNWNISKRQKYGGIINLNKCNWAIFDQHNQWDTDPVHMPLYKRAGSLIPENISVEHGILKMKTQAHPEPGKGYDCGRELEPDPDHHGSLLTKTCPHSGATIYSPTDRWHSAHPESTYTGVTVGYGRVEFRAKIVSIGHGAWPSLWLWGDDPLDKGMTGELDALEYLGDLKGDPNSIANQTGTYGIAMQTIHNWGYTPPSTGLTKATLPLGTYSRPRNTQFASQPSPLIKPATDTMGWPHLAEGVGIPIGTGEWHTYAVEYDEKEIRMYLDGCLRNTLRDGDPILDSHWDQPEAERPPPEYRAFRLPKNKRYHIIIGNPASAASWLPDWYKAYSNRGIYKIKQAVPNFKPTEFWVDYVRYYKFDDNVAIPAPASR